MDQGVRAGHSKWVLVRKMNVVNFDFNTIKLDSLQINNFEKNKMNHQRQENEVILWC